MCSEDGLGRVDSDRNRTNCQTYNNYKDSANISRLSCQDDGTWPDIPRCIEHDPGVDEQIPGTCPAIPGYCAQGFLNTRCTFDCTTGKVRARLD